MFKKASGDIVPERSVLFVCLGNICRSPTAEGVFRAEVNKAGIGGLIRVDSAGLCDDNVGSTPDARAIRAARRRGYEIAELRGRRVELADFSRFGWIIAMDDSNMRVLAALRPPEYGGHLGLLLDFAPELGIRNVPDPYFGPPEGFERTLDLIEISVRGLLARLQDALTHGSRLDAGES